MTKDTLRILIASLWICFFMVSIAFAEAIPRISGAELEELLDSESALPIDSRSGTDWRGSEFKIEEALRGTPENVESWIGSLPKEKKLVIYCA